MHCGEPAGKNHDYRPGARGERSCCGTESAAISDRLGIWLRSNETELTTVLLIKNDCYMWQLLLLLSHPDSPRVKEHQVTGSSLLSITTSLLPLRGHQNGARAGWWSTQRGKKIKFQRESHTAVGLFPSLNKCVRCSDSSVFDWKHKCHGQGGNILKWMFRCEMKRKFWSSRCSHGHTLHLNLVLTETLGRNLRHLWTRI